MTEIKVNKINEVFLSIDAEYSIRREVNDYFSVFVENWFYMRKKSPKLYNWDGKIRLYNLKKNTFYYGLLKDLKDFCKSRKYKIKLSDDIKGDYDLDLTNLDDYIADINKQLPFDIRDYQEDGFKKMVTYKRCIIVSPTASGKSLMIYLFTDYLLKNKLASKILVLTPVTSLVEQLKSDFDEYGSIYNVHCIYSGKRKSSDDPIYVSTWQSVYKMKEEYFSPFDVVIQDEAHTGVNTNPKESKAIKGILEKCVNCKYRIGLTGTIRKKKDKLLSVKGLLGQVYQVAKTKDLMIKEHISKLKVNIIKLKYSEKECKVMRKVQDYVEECDIVRNHKPRNMFIVKFINNLKKNTLVLFKYIDHGEFIYNNLVKISNKNVYYIDGKVETSEREKIRKAMEENDDSICVASYGVFAQGVNIKRLHNVIFSFSSKSEVKVNQSIGRSLRLHKTKDEAVLYDFVDDFTIGQFQNYLFKHGLERVDIYNNEDYNVEEFDYKF